MILGLIIVTNNHAFIHSDIVKDLNVLSRLGIYHWLYKEFKDNPLDVVKQSATFEDIITDYLFSCLSEDYVESMKGVDMHKSSDYLDHLLRAFMREVKIEKLPHNYKDLRLLKYTMLKLKPEDFKYFHKLGVGPYVYTLHRIPDFWAQAKGTRLAHIGM